MVGLKSILLAVFYLFHLFFIFFPCLSAFSRSYLVFFMIPFYQFYCYVYLMLVSLVVGRWEMGAVSSVPVNHQY